MTVTDIPAGGSSAYAPLIASLPDELRSFDSWGYPGGLFAYMSTLSEFIGGDRRVTPVMNAAGLSAADWHRRSAQIGD